MTLKTKLICLFIGLVVLVAGGLVISLQNSKIHELRDELSIATNNNLAYEQENAQLNGKVLEFKLTSQQLNASKDSLIQKLNAAKKQLGIKDKQISELQYIASENKKRDSIFVKDTVFLPGVVIDTSLVDKWSKLRLHAQYPNVFDVEYSFNNATDVLIHNSRVTVDPPKKCWIGRLFQKKQNIVEVDVLQENPYCVNKSSKFVKIIKK